MFQLLAVHTPQPPCEGLCQGTDEEESTWRVQAWMQEAFDLCPEELLSEYGLLLWAMQSPYNIEMLVHISNNKSGWFLVGVELCHNSDWFFFMDRISRCSQGVVGFHFSNIQMKLTVTQVRSATWNYLKSFLKWFHNWIDEQFAHWRFEHCETFENQYFSQARWRKKLPDTDSTLFYQSWKFTRVSVQQQNEQIWSFEIIQPI